MTRTTTESQRKPTGFSLIEMLVVVVVIGMLVGIFTLSLGSFAEDETQEDLRRLQALIELAREEAGIQGREYGLLFYQNSYEFSLRQAVTDAEGIVSMVWVPVDYDMQLRPRSFAEETFLEVDIEGKEVVLKFERDEKSEYEPQIFLLSSGEIEPPFKVSLRKSFSDADISFEYDLNGPVEASDEES